MGKVKAATLVKKPLTKADEETAKLAVSKLWCLSKAETAIQYEIRNQWRNESTGHWVIYDCYLMGEAAKKNTAGDLNEKRKVENRCLQIAAEGLVEETVPIGKEWTAKCEADLKKAHFRIADVGTAVLGLKDGEFLAKVQQAAAMAPKVAYT